MHVQNVIVYCTFLFIVLWPFGSPFFLFLKRTHWSVTSSDEGSDKCDSLSIHSLDVAVTPRLRKRCSLFLKVADFTFDISWIDPAAELTASWLTWRSSDWTVTVSLSPSVLIRWQDRLRESSCHVSRLSVSGGSYQDNPKQNASDETARFTCDMILVLHLFIGFWEKYIIKSEHAAVVTHSLDTSMPGFTNKA